MLKGLAVAGRRGRKKFENSLLISSNFSPGRTTTLAAMGPASEETKRGNNQGVVAHFGRRNAEQANRRLNNGSGRLFFEG
jgi:hypothetical protein